MVNPNRGNTPGGRPAAGRTRKRPRAAMTPPAPRRAFKFGRDSGNILRSVASEGVRLHPPGDFMPRPKSATPAPRAIIITAKEMFGNMANKPPTMTVIPPTFTVFPSIRRLSAMKRHGRANR